ncbi:MAG: hypothetical protein J0M34_09180 [Alphaproteobacteria bacterium]|nr:hypothetical protein [Alphaproteobacteria bacterium]
MNTSASQEGSKEFIRALLRASKPVLATNQAAGTYRPSGAPKGRSPFVVTREHGDGIILTTSGVSAPKYMGVIDILTEALGAPTSVQHVDEIGKAVTETRDVAISSVKFGDGSQLYWTAVSGFKLILPSQAAFDALATRFTESETYHGRY